MPYEHKPEIDDNPTLINLTRGLVDAAESGMQDAASDRAKACRIIAQALKETCVSNVDHNARAIIARLAQKNMLIVSADNVKD